MSSTKIKISKSSFKYNTKTNLKQGSVPKSSNKKK